jgi:hypothetical protein
MEALRVLAAPAGRERGALTVVALHGKVRAERPWRLDRVAARLNTGAP